MRKRRWEVFWWSDGPGEWFIAQPRGKSPHMWETALGRLYIRVWADSRSTNLTPFRIVRSFGS